MVDRYVGLRCAQPNLHPAYTYVGGAKMFDKSIKAFSLFECMVAMTLSTFLMLALIKVVLYFKASQQSQEAWAKLMQEGYYLSAYFLPRLATVGDAYCNNLKKPDHFVEGYSAGHYPHYLSEQNKVKGDLIVLTRCENQDGSFQFKQRAYYVSLTERRNAKGQIISALYEKPIDGPRIELEEGVAAMRIDYVINNRESYSADQVTDWSKLVGVNLHFILSSASVSSMVIQRPWDVYVALRSR